MVLYKTIRKKRSMRRRYPGMRRPAFNLPQGNARSLVPRQITPELKAVDCANAGQNAGFATPIQISTTAFVTTLNQIKLGSDTFQRVGRKVMMKSLHLTGTIQRGTLGHVDDYCRVMVVYDRQPNGGGFAISQLLSSNDEVGAISSTAMDFPNISFAERFLILADNRLALNGPAATNDTAAVNTDFKGEYNINRFIKLKNLVAHYDISSISTDVPTCGALLLIAFGSVPAATASYQLTWTSRLRYHDI